VQEQKLESIVSGINIPSGIAVEVVHEEDPLKDFYYLIGMAFLLIYMILASVFESFSTPVSSDVQHTTCGTGFTYCANSYK